MKIKTYILNLLILSNTDKKRQIGIVIKSILGNNKIIKVADLVSEGREREKVLEYLRNMSKIDDVDIIIAMAMAIEGFDWPFCEHALTIGYRASLTQIIQISPAFPTVNDVITLQYDAGQGNGGLIGVSPVYTHTGIVTQSGLPSSWSYVQGNWGQADTNVLMTDLGNNLHEIVIDIDQYYGFPNGTNVAKTEKSVVSVIHKPFFQII